MLEHRQDCGRISFSLVPWEQKGSVREAFVTWKHRGAEAAERQARRENTPLAPSDGTSPADPHPGDSKQGQTWGWERGKNSLVIDTTGKERQRESHKRQMTFPTKEDEKCWTLGRMIWTNRLGPYFRQGFIKAGFIQSFHSEWSLLLSVPKPRQVCRRETLLQPIIQVVSQQMLEIWGLKEQLLFP